MSGHWDDIIGATRMTKKGATRMTKKGATRMTKKRSTGMTGDTVLLVNKKIIKISQVAS
ncbi:hypothetical protein [Wolbachia endosymbiont (group A) of Sphaerophoria taeniata]|uniref:hypothetical protein n=1 Tax=Wolbachia endosymbiont (group A) of Sphaerophoria taeniata TaxID=2954057 RepID=UPI002227D2DE|nr:hypothetical protein [Wolbachia endosymbiont (group A) of Sphaerophoria taeniata]